MAKNNWINMLTGNREITGERLPFQEALHGLLEFTQLLGSLKLRDGAGGATPTIILTAAGIEVRMSDPAPAPGAPQQDRLRRIEEGLESVRQATAALTAAFHEAAFQENVARLDATLAEHAVVIESVRAALSQNEQLMENLVELMVPGDFNLSSSDELANIS